MRGYLHYNIWNKANHIDLILRGINYFVPKDTIIDFSFEDCKDESLIIFNELKEKYLNDYHVIVTEATHRYRMKNFNEAIRRFLKYDCDFIVSPQDDQFIQDSALFDNIKSLLSSVENIGIIGTRDGFTFDFRNYYSSHFSVKTNNHIKWLKSGDVKLVKCINDGALIIPKKTIEKVGLFDEDMTAFYIENDYCARCIKAGLVNMVLGTELIHLKLYGALASELYETDFDYASKDFKILQTKHPDLQEL
jgi:hypothetical protein